VGTPGNPQRERSKWLRARFLSGLSPKRPHRRLYITRRAANKRRIVNESELEPVLQEFGFEIIEAEHLSLKAQIELFAEAEAVAGPHGAGLTNILFSPSGCKVLELLNPAYMNVCYYAEAEMLGHEYWYVIGETAGTAVQHRTACHDDISVSVPTFRQTLRTMFSA
jgi:capsular polysaccharide biosynthesis protein